MVVNNKKKYKERKGHRNFTVGYVRRCKKKKMEKHKTPDQQDEREKKTRRKQKLKKWKQQKKWHPYSNMQNKAIKATGIKHGSYEKENDKRK